MPAEKIEKFMSPKPTYFPKKTIEEFAEKIASIRKFKPGDDIFAIAKRMGGRIVIGTTGKGDEESGSLIARSLSDWTIYLSPATSLARDRFTIAHELGHLFLHMPKEMKKPMRATRYMKDGDQEHKRAEWEANWFAAAFLMPAGKFKEVYSDGKNSACRLYFQMSLSAVNARAESLGLS